MPGNLITIMDANGEMATVTGGKLDVNASVTGSDGAIQDGVDTGIKATVFDGATANPLGVTLLDANGDAVAVGGGTQYTEDAAAAADPVGTALMMVRDDALSAQTSTDGDNIAARGTDKGELYVKHADTIAVTQSGTWDEVGINDSGNSITVDNPILSVVGGGTEATAQRVTLASDSTGVLSVDDNGASLTVDGTVTAAGDVGTLDQLDLANTNPLAVAIVDGTGDQITSFGGGTQYTEDAAAAADPVGTALIMVRDDALSAQTSTDGDNIAARGTDKGELYVKHVDAIPVTDNGGALTVDGTVTANLAAGTNNIGDVDVLSIAAGDNNIGNVDIVTVPAPLSTTGGGTEAAALRVTIASDSTGVLSVDDNGGALTVDGTVTANLAAGTNNIGDVDVLTIPGIVGTVADDSITPGNPVMVGGQAVSPDGTDPGSVAEADVVRFKTDLNRRLYVATNHPRTWRYHLNTSTAQTDTQIQASPGAGFRTVITHIQFTSGAATAINLFLEESTTTIWGPIYLEAVAGRGYVSGPIFLPITAATAVTYTTSAAIAQAIDILGFIEAV